MSPQQAVNRLGVLRYGYPSTVERRIRQSVLSERGILYSITLVVGGAGEQEFLYGAAN